MRERDRNLTTLIGGLCIREKESLMGLEGIELTGIIFHPTTYRKLIVVFLTLHPPQKPSVILSPHFPFMD